MSSPPIPPTGLLEEDLNIAVVNQRSISSLLVLISRSFVMQMISLGGFFLLSAYLSIAEIGVFFAVSEIVALLGYFSDVGLAAALIQKHDKVQLEDVRTTFTIQQILVTVLCVFILASTPWIRVFFNLNQEGVWLVWALVAGFFLSSLKTIP